jgi:ketosteroid isomerase-like protein
MSVERNKELIRHIYAEVSNGRGEAFLDALADDVRYTLTGSTAFSGTYVGKDALLERVFTPILDQIDGPVVFTPENLIGEGEYVVQQSRGSAKTKSGKRYDQTYCHVFRIVDGKIKEMTEYLDTELITSVLT